MTDMENFLEAEQPAFGDTDLIQAQIAQSDVSSDHLTSQFKYHVYSLYNTVRSAHTVSHYEYRAPC